MLIETWIGRAGEAKILGAEYHLLDRLVIGQHGEDDPATGGLGRRRRYLSARRDQGPGLVRRAISHRNRMAGLDEAHRDGASHMA